MQIYKWMPAKVDQRAQLVLATQDGFDNANDPLVLAANTLETNDILAQKISDDTSPLQVQSDSVTTLSPYEPHTENKLNPASQEPANNNKENLVTDPNTNTRSN